MKQKMLLITVLVIVCLFVTACSGNLFVESTSTPISTNTSQPTDTPMPSNTVTPTYTSRPTKTPEPRIITPTPDLPQGTPISDLQGIPIMPGAIAGNAKEDYLYNFITKRSQEEVTEYYILTLIQLGWEYLEQFEISPGKHIWISPNSDGGYIIHLGINSSFFYIYEAGGLTHVQIYYNP